MLLLFWSGMQLFFGLPKTQQIGRRKKKERRQKKLKYDLADNADEKKMKYLNCSGEKKPQRFLRYDHANNFRVLAVSCTAYNLYLAKTKPTVWCNNDGFAYQDKCTC